MTLRALALDHAVPGRRFAKAAPARRRTVDAAAAAELTVDHSGTCRPQTVPGAADGVAA